MRVSAARRKRAIAAVAEQRRIATKAARLVRATFNEERLAVRAALRAGTDPTAAVTEERWGRVLERIWLDLVAEKIYPETVARLTSTKGESSLERRVRRRLAEYAKGNRQSITERTKRDLQQLFEEGTTDPQQLMESLYRYYGVDRSERIALQEVLLAAAAAQHEAAFAVARAEAAAGKERPFLKIWITVGDDVVRDSHVAADGQVRSMDEPYDVGGSLLDYPRDWKGPAGEVINCRCWEEYFRDEA